MCDDIQNCCRICLDVESDHVAILGDSTICLHLKSCLSITISSSDHLPKTICVSCVSLLNQFYNFHLNARCSQDWLESSFKEKNKKSSENKMPLQPLPDSEYNSDSLLEFLNNTANIEEYLNNLGKEDIPCIVNMLDRNEQSIDNNKANNKSIKLPSPKKRESSKKLKMDIDILDSDFKIVKELIKKGAEPKTKVYANKTDKNSFICYGCKTSYETMPKLLQHISVCDIACRTCLHCNALFDSRQKMQQHSLLHSTSLSCNCGEQFLTKERLLQHHKTCHSDYGSFVGCTYRCKECGDIFKERFQLYKHAKEHVMKAEQRICDICGHTFIGNEALLKHRKKEHEHVMYRCKICSTTSTDHKEMYLHVKNHTTLPEQPHHLCESCGHSFATQATLLRHSLLHSNKTKCNVCEKTFKHEKAYNEHMKEHIELVICERCGQHVDSFKLDRHKCV